MPLSWVPHPIETPYSAPRRTFVALLPADRFGRKIGAEEAPCFGWWPLGDEPQREKRGRAFSLLGLGTEFMAGKSLGSSRHQSIPRASNPDSAPCLMPPSSQPVYPWVARKDCKRRDVSSPRSPLKLHPPRYIASMFWCSPSIFATDGHAAEPASVGCSGSHLSPMGGHPLGDTINNGGGCPPRFVGRGTPESQCCKEGISARTHLNLSQAFSLVYA